MSLTGWTIRIAYLRRWTILILTMSFKRRGCVLNSLSTMLLSNKAWHWLPSIIHYAWLSRRTINARRRPRKRLRVQWTRLSMLFRCSYIANPMA